jgi:quinoprotein glucose dehydrogenase
MFRALLFVVVGSGLAVAFTPPAVVEKDLPDGKDAAQKQIAAFKTSAPFQIDLFAAEPMLASPVAIGLDDKNRVYVAEEFRFNQGTEENRTRGFFLNDDLQLKTVEDRLKMYEKHKAQFPGGMEWFTKHADQVRLLEDSKGVGKADKSTVFAGGFNAAADGLAAGVMAFNGKVYLTCIPNLWELSEEKNGVAQKRKALATGFGVNCAFLGHDLHGLIVGPDGKLYFSVGDRGYHVVTQEGKTLSNPRRGAVFKCNLDGSELEVVHTGLRNPQELAFDEHGNLFADDNNCDKGDHARLVYIVEGGDSGWNMAYQTIPDPYLTGPWHAERLWHLPHEGQAAWIVPPVGKIGTGPSGFLFTSGTSLPERYKNAFIMCNYTGNGGLEAFKVKEQGAGFEIQDYHDFLKPIRATDAEFGTDGKLYVSDFVDLKWDGGSAGGRIYTVYDKAKIESETVRETKKLFAEGFDKQDPAKLMTLLNHPDQRVRQRAQFELVNRGPIALPIFTKGLRSEGMIALHSAWGLGMLGKKVPEAYTVLAGDLPQAQNEVLSQIAKTLGEAKYAPASKELLRLLNSAQTTPRQKFFLAQALGQLGEKAAMPSLVSLLATTKESDPQLRHALILALSRTAKPEDLLKLHKHESAAVRLACVLVLRRRQSEAVAEFLTDRDLLVRAEAARVINDLPLDNLTARLAACAKNLPAGETDAFARRALHAAFRLGTASDATAVVEAVMNPSLSPLVRSEALASLRDWANPGPRDRVNGIWRPVASRDGVVAKTVVQSRVDALLSQTAGKLQSEVVETLVVLKVDVNETDAVKWATDTKQSANLRAAALQLLLNRGSKKFDEISTQVLKSGPPKLAASVREILIEKQPARASQLLVEVLQNEQAALVEQQRAINALTKLKNAEATSQLDLWAVKLTLGEVKRELQVDVQDALKAVPSPVRDKLRTAYEKTLPKDAYGKFEYSLTGGDAERGREIFVNHTAAQCIRCHMIDKQGGNAGPDLSKVVQRNPAKTREYLLESIVLPSAKIATGYANITATLADGRTVAGVILEETKSQLTLQTPDGKKLVIPTNDIDARTQPTSPMPSAERALTPMEIRDLIEYLMTLK